MIGGGSTASNGASHLWYPVDCLFGASVSGHGERTGLFGLFDLITVVLWSPSRKRDQHIVPLPTDLPAKGARGCSSALHKRSPSCGSACAACYVGLKFQSDPQHCALPPPLPTNDLKQQNKVTQNTRHWEPVA